MDSNFNPIDTVWILLCAGLVFIMQAGFLCLESGFTRTKNSINVAVKNVTDFALSVAIFWMVGFALMFGESFRGIFGTSLFFADISTGQPWLSSFFVFQAMFCGTAVTIVSGAVAERMSFVGYLAITLVVSLFIYPIFGHWAWGGVFSEGSGWLANLGFIDFAGSTVVHSVGGWVALVAVIFIGARKGRFLKDGSPREIQGQTLPLAMLGGLLLFFGWIGFNGGSTLVLDESVPGIVGNTILGGIAGSCVMLLAGWVWKRYPNPKHPINGLIAGLVAVTANCHLISGWQALLIGGIAGVIVLLLEKFLENRRIDDVVGAFPVHAGAGIWGTIAVAIFGDSGAFAEGVTRIEQFQIQLLGIVTCMAISVIPTVIFMYVMEKIRSFRVNEHEETIGLNVAEHNATTEYLDLLLDMAEQASSSDLNRRVSVEPFTEVGQIASKYNEILESLQITVARNEMIIRDTEDGVISIADNGRILSVNPGAERMFGIREKDFLKRSISSIVKGSGPDFVKEKDANAGHVFGDRGLHGLPLEGDSFPIEIESSARQIGKRTVLTLKIRNISQREEHRKNMTVAKENAEKARDELQNKVEEIEAFNEIAVNRELRMLELKEHINHLSIELGKDPPYVFNKESTKKAS